MSSLAKFKSHKIVEAGQITDVPTANAEGQIVLAVQGADGVIGVPVDAGYLQKHQPFVGGYYVQYADGYASFSPAGAFEDGYTPFDPTAPTQDSELAEAKTMVKKLEDQLIDLDATVEQERAKHATTIESNRQLRELVEMTCPILGINIDDYATREALVEAIQQVAAGRAAVAPPTPSAPPSDVAVEVLRAVLKIPPAQTRDDGGRIIHLDKRTIDRILALV